MCGGGASCEAGEGGWVGEVESERVHVSVFVVWVRVDTDR